jgi:hypothetical protein
MKHLSDNETADLYRLYKLGYSCADLSRKFGISTSGVEHIIKKSGLEPARRVSFIEMMHYICVKNLGRGYLNLDASYDEVISLNEIYPRISKLPKLQFLRLMSEVLTLLGWTTGGKTSKTFARPTEHPKIEIPF